MMLRTFDCGYGLALVLGRDASTARVFRWHFPFPLTLKSWKYLWRHHHARQL